MTSSKKVILILINSALSYPAARSLYGKYSKVTAHTAYILNSSRPSLSSLIILDANSFAFIGNA
jgi:hypothetical protein